MDRRQTALKLSPFADVHEELTEMSFRRLLPTAILAAMGLVGTTLEIASKYHDLFLYGLSAVMALLASIRIVVVLARLKSASFKARLSASRRWQRFFDVTLLLYSVTIATSTFRNFHAHRAPAEMLCALGTFIICIGINGRIGPNPASAKIQGVLMLLVLAICIFNPHDSLAMTGVVIIGMFALAHCQAVQDKFDLVVDQIRSRRKLRLLSECDALTGLANRRGFEIGIDALCKRGEVFALLLIDLDRFKPVNDNHGHGAGDLILQAVAQRLRTAVRAQDVVARMGGDEFAILQMPSTSLDDAESLARRINQRISEPFNLGELSLSIGTSIGISVATANHSQTADLMQRADAALYQAKQGGRGGFVSCAGITALGPFNATQVLSAEGSHPHLRARA